jgi:hypothetical protein
MFDPAASLACLMDYGAIRVAGIVGIRRIWP